MNLLLWLVLYPAHFVLRVLLFWVPPVWKRVKFENQNLKEPGCRSFADTMEKADLAFEFSSEGEYQQVAPLIDDALSENKKIELVFFSPSVEKAIRELHSKYPNNIRYLRYPIATLGPLNSFSSWTTSKELILVRYDFLPEFLGWAGVIKILWVTFKKERTRGKKISFYKKLFLHKAKLIVYATEEDAGFGRGRDAVVYDFRIEQIRRRCLHREEKFAKIFPDYGSFRDVLKKYPREKTLIIGNAWPVDMDLLKEIPKDFLVVIVPHKLETQIMSEMTTKLQSFNRHPLMIADKWPGEASTYIVNKKGILCELYGDFGKAYVGGGFGVSVHSILEPLVSGSDRISCGPVNYRSTEFDVAMKLGDLTEVKSAGDFAQWVITIPTLRERDKLESTYSQYAKLKREVLLC